MSYIELYIDDQLLDLEDNQSIVQTFQINSFFSLSDRQANFTNRFTIPETTNNFNVFSKLGLVGNQTRFPYQVHKANLVIDGVPLVINGTANFKKLTDGKGWEVYIYSGVNSIFEALADRPVSSLDFSDLNHTLDNTTFTNSLNNTDGYIYALLDTGKMASGNPIIIDELVPSVFLKTIFDKIFTEAGFTYSGGIFAKDIYTKKLIVPNNIYEPVDTTVTVQTVFEGTTEDTFISRGQGLTVIPFVGADPNSVLAARGLALQIFETGQYDISVDIDFTLSSSKLLDIYKFTVFQNGKPLKSVAIAALNVSDTIDLPVFLTAGDFLSLGVEINTIDETVADIRTIETVDYVVDFKLDTTNSTTNVNFNQLFLEGITQKEFLKEVLQQFGLLLRRVPNSREYEFIELREMLSDRANAVDFTEKFNGRKSQSYEIDNLAQISAFKYKYGEGESPFADGSLTINNQVAKKTQTLIESSMRGSRLTTKSVEGSTELLYSTAHFKDSGDGFEREDAGTYIFDLVVVDTEIDYKTAAAGSALTFTGNVPFANFKNLVFPVLIEEYYTQYALILNSPVKEEFELFLDVLDIQALDFFKLIYISQMGRYYYLESVKNFEQGKPTTIEAIQVSSFDNTLAPTIGDNSILIAYDETYTFEEDDFLNTSPPFYSPDGATNPTTFTLEEEPLSGELRNFGVKIDAGETFSWSDVQDGFIQYVPTDTFDNKTFNSSNVDTGTNIITLNETDADINNNARMIIATLGTLPVPFEAGVVYYAGNTTVTPIGRIAVKASSGGANIDITSQGSGNGFIRPAPDVFRYSAKNVVSFNSSNIANMNINFE